jgi:hypothetical protein
MHDATAYPQKNDTFYHTIMLLWQKVEPFLQPPGIAFHKAFSNYNFFSGGDHFQQKNGAPSSKHNR